MTLTDLQTALRVLRAIDIKDECRKRQTRGSGTWGRALDLAKRRMEGIIEDLIGAPEQTKRP